LRSQEASGVITKDNSNLNHTSAQNGVLILQIPINNGNPFKIPLAGNLSEFRWSVGGVTAAKPRKVSKEAGRRKIEGNGSKDSV